jgi:hypothetical protein
MKTYEDWVWFDYKASNYACVEDTIREIQKALGRVNVELNVLNTCPYHNPTGNAVVYEEDLSEEQFEKLEDEKAECELCCGESDNNLYVFTAKNNFSNNGEKAEDQITVSWCVDDIKEVRADLTTEQCREVLQKLDYKHDASIGINWEVISCVADDLFPEK